MKTALAVLLLAVVIGCCYSRPGRPNYQPPPPPSSPGTEVFQDYIYDDQPLQPAPSLGCQQDNGGIKTYHCMCTLIISSLFPLDLEAPLCGPCYLERDECKGGRTKYAVTCKECCEKFHGKSYREEWLNGKCCSCRDRVNYA